MVLLNKCDSVHLSTDFSDLSRAGTAPHFQNRLQSNNQSPSLYCRGNFPSDGLISPINSASLSNSFSLRTNVDDERFESCRDLTAKIHNFPKHKSRHKKNLKTDDSNRRKSKAKKKERFHLSHKLNKENSREEVRKTLSAASNAISRAKTSSKLSEPNFSLNSTPPEAIVNGGPCEISPVRANSAGKKRAIIAGKVNRGPTANRTRNLSAGATRSYRARAIPHSEENLDRPPSRQKDAFPFHLVDVDSLNSNRTKSMEITATFGNMNGTLTDEKLERPPSRHKWMPYQNSFDTPELSPETEGSDWKANDNVTLGRAKRIIKASKEQNHDPCSDGFLALDESVPPPFRIEINTMAKIQSGKLDSDQPTQDLFQKVSTSLIDRLASDTRSLEVCSAPANLSVTENSSFLEYQHQMENLNLRNDESIFQHSEDKRWFNDEQKEFSLPVRSNQFEDNFNNFNDTFVTSRNLTTSMKKKRFESTESNSRVGVEKQENFTLNFMRDRSFSHIHHSEERDDLSLDDFGDFPGSGLNSSDSLNSSLCKDFLSLFAQS